MSVFKMGCFLEFSIVNLIKLHKLNELHFPEAWWGPSEIKKPPSLSLHPCRDAKWVMSCPSNPWPSHARAVPVPG